MLRRDCSGVIDCALQNPVEWAFAALLVIVCIVIVVMLPLWIWSIVSDIRRQDELKRIREELDDHAD